MSQNVLPILIEEYIFEIKYSRPRGHPLVNFRFNEVGVRTESHSIAAGNCCCSAHWSTFKTQDQEIVE